VLPREPGSGRVLTAGRQLDRLHAVAVRAGLPVVPVWLDVRGRVERCQPWELEAADREVREFLTGLGRANSDTAARAILRDAATTTWQLAAGLWAGLALDPERLAPAWQVTTSAPESSLLLAGTNWHTLDETEPAAARPVSLGSTGPAA